MKARIYFIFCAVHLLIILVHSISGTIFSYCTFYKKEMPKNGLYEGMTSFVYSDPVMAYSAYTATETGYGYFAPNVLSSGFITFKTRDKEFRICYSNKENQLRYTNLTSTFIQNAIQPNKEQQALKLGGKYETFGKLDSTYHDLILKNLSSHIFQQNKGIDTLYVSLNLYDYPSMARYRKNDKHLNIIKLYEKKYFLKGDKL